MQYRESGIHRYLWGIGVGESANGRERGRPGFFWNSAGGFRAAAAQTEQAQQDRTNLGGQLQFIPLGHRAKLEVALAERRVSPFEGASHVRHEIPSAAAS